MGDLDEAQLYEIFHSLKNYREIPLKYAYCGTGSRNWDKMIHSPDQLSVGAKNLEDDFLINKVSHFLIKSLKYQKRVNIFDIGSGTGDSALPILRSLSNAGISLNYFPVDISEELLKIAKDTVQKELADIVVTEKKFDFEIEGEINKLVTNQQEDSVNVFLFLGNTLANMPKRKMILQEFTNSSKNNDLFVVALELFNKAKLEELINYYGNGNAVTFVYRVPELFNLNQRNTELNVIWNEKLSQIELNLKPTEEIKITYKKETLYLTTGDTVQLALSLKFTDKLLNDLFNLDSIHRNTLEHNSYSISILQKTDERSLS